MSPHLAPKSLSLVGLALMAAGGIWWFQAAAPHGYAEDPGEMRGSSSQDQASPGETGPREVPTGPQLELAEHLARGGTKARTEITPTVALAVRVTRKKFPLPNRRVVVSGPTSPTDESPFWAEAVTDRSGIARFPVTPHSTLEVAVDRTGGAEPATRDVHVGAGGSKLRVRMELYSEIPPERVSVMVTSIPDGAPIVGARVSALRGTHQSSLVVGPVIETDAQGRASLPWARQYRYEVAARGHSPWEVPAPTTEGQLLAITLVRHARLHGRLSHSVDRPEAGSKAPRIIIFQGDGPAASARCELVTDLRGDDEMPENLFSDRGGLIRPQARLDLDGRWEVSSIPFSRNRQIQEGVAVRCDLVDHTRTVAMNITLRPGDDLLVQDMARGDPALNAVCVDAKGRRLDLDLEVTLRRMDEAATSSPWDFFGEVDLFVADGGLLHLPRLSTGEWALFEWSEPIYAEPVAILNHQTAAEVNIVILREPIPQEWRRARKREPESAPEGR